MHLTTTFLVLIGTVSALNVTSLVKSNSRIAVPAEFRRPNGAADIDLDELLSERITKRKAMTYCADQDSTDGDCKSLSSSVSGSLAATLKSRANNKECGVTSGSIDGVDYSFYTSPSPRCDTTAERGTIQGGLNRYFDYLGGNICGVHCVRLNHGGGTYRAYITLGPAGADLDSVNCARTEVYVDCGNGGQNDS